MPISIIVDGYNLIRQSPELSRIWDLDLEAARDALAERLTRYKRLHKHKITVVYDGAHWSASGRNAPRARGIRTIFSRGGEKADDVIRRMVSKEAEGKIVVTSDRDLARSVESAGAATIDSPTFEARLFEAEINAVKGVIPDEGGEESTGRRRTSTKKKGPARRAPKKERKKSRRLGKL